jgi:dihydrofolate reductase
VALRRAAPVFVLTHHEHELIEMEAGTTFHLVTEGFDKALEMAREVGDGDVDIAGGASTVRQALESGELDELTLDVVPVLLGTGERLFGGAASIQLEPIEAEHSPWATHVRYEIAR